MKQIREQDYVIALALDGKMLDSVELSQKISRLGVEGKEFDCLCDRWFTWTWR